jgi:prepilin-type processing-associated H-X9-DG protein
MAPSDFASSASSPRSRLWLASIVCSIAALVVFYIATEGNLAICFFALLPLSALAILLGLVSFLRRARSSKLSAAATLLGLLSLLFIPATSSYWGRRIGRVACAMNLRQVGQGLLLYAHDHGGKYPATLAELQKTTDLEPQYLLCDETHKPFIFTAANRIESTINPAEVVAYEPVEYHVEGSNVLFGDGHVEWVYRSQLPALLDGSATRPSTQPAPSSR